MTSRPAVPDIPIELSAERVTEALRGVPYPGEVAAALGWQHIATTEVA